MSSIFRTAKRTLSNDSCKHILYSALPHTGGNSPRPAASTLATQPLVVKSLPAHPPRDYEAAFGALASTYRWGPSLPAPSSSGLKVKGLPTPASSTPHAQKSGTATSQVLSKKDRTLDKLMGKYGLSALGQSR
ncbi:hypothetical protein FA95DRAFT_1556917 [Auriscalpium vulgare]|uniref:Uncharacterized protein n=1 Tax=Auriscalpium vulgare TaxID=40419 RepID=A0ACB8S010_9AGAM|nr:hypothetical protein FA95DRAFT_1556917 [Auriscalpium vulgare]